MCPGRTEDQKGRQFIGRSGDLLGKALRAAGVSRDNDCMLTNAVQCRPPEDKWPGNKVAALCKPRLVQQLQAFKPKMIICLGEHAVHSIIDLPKTLAIGTVRGTVFASQKFGCYAIPAYHPAYFLRNSIADDTVLLGILPWR